MSDPRAEVEMPEMPEWIDLAADIRAVDGNHDLGAGALAEALTRRGWSRVEPRQFLSEMGDIERRYTLAVHDLYCDEAPVGHTAMAHEPFRRQRNWTTPTNLCRGWRLSPRWLLTTSSSPAPPLELCPDCKGTGYIRHSGDMHFRAALTPADPSAES